MKLNFLAYIVIAVLVAIILLQNKCSTSSPYKETRDTVIVYKIIHDTIPGEIVYIKGKSVRDTVWLTSKENEPDTTYNGLLNQYTTLGNNHFEKRIFKTTFPIVDYGSISIYDTVKANLLIGSSMITDLKIPITTITVEKQVPYRALYLGLEITGSKTSNGLYGRTLFKTKKDNLYSISGGWEKEWKLGGGIYWKIK